MVFSKNIKPAIIKSISYQMAINKYLSMPTQLSRSKSRDFGVTLDRIISSFIFV